MDLNVLYYEINHAFGNTTYTLSTLSKGGFLDNHNSVEIQTVDEDTMLT